MQIKDKHVLITGGSEGLGFAIAKAFTQHQSKVTIISRNQNKLQSAKKQLNNQVNTHAIDVTNITQLQHLANTIDPIDILINNAGIWLEGDLTQNSFKQISRIIDTNLKGVIYTTKTFLPVLLKRPQAHLINISSTSGLKPREHQAVYVASKYGVRGFTDSLKLDYLNTNLKITGFYPGGMKTNFFASANSPKNNQNWLDPHKLAQTIIHLIKQDDTMVIDHLVINKRLLTN